MQLTNIRTDNSKSKMHDARWNAKILFGVDEKPYCTLLMCLAINRKKSDLDKKKLQQNKEWIKIMNGLRENDLLLLSKEHIKNPHSFFNSDKIKKKGAHDIFDPNRGYILCMVSKKAKKNSERVSLKASSDFGYKIDSLLKMMNDKNKEFFCYYITSLSTLIREFKALNKIEFSGFSDLILNPNTWYKFTHSDRKIEEDKENELENKTKLSVPYQHFLNISK